MTIVSYSLNLTVKMPQPILINTLLLGLSVLFLTLLYRVESTAHAPLIHLELLRDSRFSFSFAVNFIVSTVIMTSLVVSPFYLTAALGLRLTDTGLVMATSPILVAATSYLNGRKLNEKNINASVTCGVMLLTIGTVCLSQLNSSLGVIGYIACITFTAVGHGMFTSSNNTQIMGVAQENQRGQISGLLNLSRNIGLLTGATLMSTLFELSTGASTYSLIPANIAELGLNRVYSFASILLCLALAVRFYQYRQDKITKT